MIVPQTLRFTRYEKLEEPMAQGKRALRRRRAAEAAAEKERPTVQVLRPQAFDGFIVEPAPGRGTRLCFMRSRTEKDTRIAFGTPDGPVNITLSDVALKAVAKQINGLVKL